MTQPLPPPATRPSPTEHFSILGGEMDNNTPAGGHPRSGRLGAPAAQVVYFSPVERGRDMYFKLPTPASLHPPFSCASEIRIPKRRKEKLSSTFSSSIKPGSSFSHPLTTPNQNHPPLLPGGPYPGRLVACIAPRPMPAGWGGWVAVLLVKQLPRKGGRGLVWGGLIPGELVPKRLSGPRVLAFPVVVTLQRMGGRRR